MKKIFYLFTLVMLMFVVSACTEPFVGVKISYKDSQVEMTVGQTINVKPVVEASEGITSYTIDYLLSSEIAEIDEEGNLKALEAGEVTIVASVVEYSAEAELTVTINPKATYTIALDAAGGEGLSSNTITFTEGEKVTLPIVKKPGFLFLGWYENDELVEEITDKNYDLVAKWQELEGQVKVSYELGENVFLGNYNTRNDVVQDLVKDVQSIKGSTFTLDYFNAITGTGYGIFASAQGDKTFFANEQMRIKWSWLLEYAKDLREKDNNDVNQYNSLIVNGYVDADAATINLEMIAFICGKQCSYQSGEVAYVSSDYSKIENSNGFWEKMHYELELNSVFEQGTEALAVLPGARKQGSTFIGWYTSSDLSEASKVTSSTVLMNDVTLYPKFEKAVSKVTFDYNGGVSVELYKKYGTKVTSLGLDSYNGKFWDGTNYTKSVFVSNQANDPAAKFSTRIYFSKDELSGVYRVVSILGSGTTSEWPNGADYVITISGQYSGKQDDNFTLSKVSLNQVVVFDKDVTSASASSVVNMNFYEEKVLFDEVTTTVNEDFIMPSATKVGFKFAGWYDDYNNKYETAEDLLGVGTIVVYAKWSYEEHIIGSFETNSWVAKGKTIKLLAEYLNDDPNKAISWESQNQNIAKVDQNGVVTGVSEGLATIVVSDASDPDISFTFYVTVFNEDPSGVLKVIADSNNESIYIKSNLIIGIASESGAYYTDIIGSVSQLLFEEYVVHNDFYLSNPSNKSTLTGDGKGGIDFITFHYAADMPYSANYSLRGGYNLASYNKSCNTNGTSASWHYSTGNDGVWACQNEAYGAWHAGTSKTMKWYPSGVTTSQVGKDIYSTDVTLNSDNYFYIAGVKTKVQNTTGYSKLNGMGLAVKLVGNEWYIGGAYYNSSYKYISSLGGNNNSIGIESSVRKGSDLWLTWHYSAQLCANLLLKYDLPIQRLVGHHFFSGKWCPQPMLENDLEIWYEFVGMVEQEMEYFKNYSNYELSFSSNSKYVNNLGRVTSLPAYDECITYTVTYKTGSTTKTVTLSSIIPGTVGK